MKAVHKVSIVALAMAALAISASVVAAGVDTTTPSSQFVPRSDYEKLLKEVESLKDRVTAAEQTAKQTAVQQTEIQQYMQMTKDAAAESGEKGPQAVGLYANYPGSLFDGELHQEYFAPISLMNPAFNMQDDHLKIGHWNDMDVYLGLNTVGRFQAFTQKSAFKNGTRLEGVNPGFQTPFANLNFLADFNGKMQVYTDIYISSRGHPSTTYGHEGFILVHALPSSVGKTAGGLAGMLQSIFDSVDIKAGAFDIAYGDHIYTRTVNAKTNHNPLIGNYVIDPEEEEIGLEVYSKPANPGLHWLAGVGSGSTTEHFAYGGGFSVHGKLWLDLCDHWRVSASAYHVDNSGDPNAAGGGSKASLFSGNRSNGPFAAIFGGGDSPGQITPGGGQNVTAAQGDITYQNWPFEVSVFGGWVRDGDSNGSDPGKLTDEWFYASAQVVYHINTQLYLAARYSGGYAVNVPAVGGGFTPSDGMVHRFEVGGGYWLTRNILAKVSYVHEFYTGFNANAGNIDGVDASRDPYFTGAIAEVWFGF